MPNITVRDLLRFITENDNITLDTPILVDVLEETGEQDNLGTFLLDHHERPARMTIEERNNGPYIVIGEDT